MEKAYLDCSLREEKGKNKMGSLRRSGFIPAVIYGKGKEPLVIQVDHGHLVKFMHAHHGGENMIITLRIFSNDNQKASKKEERAVLIKEIQYEPVHDSILHVDFNEISLTEKIVVNVPIEAKGEPEGVKKENGVLTHVLWELEVECLPTDIPEKIVVDIESMQIGDTIHVKDLKIPSSATILTDQDSIVFNLVPPKKVEESAEAVVEGEEVSAEPEVIKKEKKEEETEEEAPKEKEETS